ncbi:MAG: ADP-ribosylglycohydrolase family protein [Candidatus Hodarchaeota archaeon]
MGAPHSRHTRTRGPSPCDSRETVPLALALFHLAHGDVERSVTYAANFGRDADTIATMCGAIAGALRGVEGIKPAWVEKAHRFASVDQEEQAARLASVALAKHETEGEISALFGKIERHQVEVRS